MQQKIINFTKQNTILIISWTLAIVSMFYVHPSIKYIEYIDFRMLLILWSLMVVIKGYMDANVFDIIAVKLLGIINNMRQLCLVLVTMCFFASMIITNDVALITFVPFSIIILRGYGIKRYIIPILVLETIAANLGSMLTPIGNPQNLYLYNISNMILSEFVVLITPLSIISLVLLIVCVLILFRENDSINVEDKIAEIKGIDGDEVVVFKNARTLIALYTLLFVLTMLVVVHVVHIVYAVMAVFLAFLLYNHMALVRVDYGLLMTFMGFFVFTGNMSKIPAVYEILTSLVDGREVIIGILVSQIISNVPAALMLSDFTNNIEALIIGVDIGGLGTLIASMASLITFKSFCNEYQGEKLVKSKYILIFSLFNIGFMLALFSASCFI